MCGCTIFECLNIVLDGVNWDIEMFSSLCEHHWVMDTLSSRSDLFSSHEKVIGVGVVWIMRVKHGVEWSSIGWISVQHVEISVILLSYESSKSFLSLC